MVDVASSPDSKQTFNGVKVFSATMVAERDNLGEKVTNWLANRPEVKLVDIVVSQSSDASFHCVALTVFYYEPLPARR